MIELDAQRIEKLLCDDFEIAVKEKNSALEEFNSVIEDTPQRLAPSGRSPADQVLFQEILGGASEHDTCLGEIE
jgi:hypothetical protein